MNKLAFKFGLCDADCMKINRERGCERIFKEAVFVVLFAALALATVPCAWFLFRRLRGLKPGFPRASRRAGLVRPSVWLLVFALAEWALLAGNWGIQQLSLKLLMENRGDLDWHARVWWLVVPWAMAIMAGLTRVPALKLAGWRWEDLRKPAIWKMSAAAAVAHLSS